MKLTATQLRQAGFDEETILGLIENQRPILKQAGLSMKHQDILQAGQGMETLEKQNEKQ